MKLCSAIGFVGGLAVLGMLPAAGAWWNDAFPNEPGKRVMLDACARSDPGFNRLLAAARRVCYRRGLDSGQAAPTPRPPPASAAGRLIQAG